MGAAPMVRGGCNVPGIPVHPVGDVGVVVVSEAGASLDRPLKDCVALAAQPVDDGGIEGDGTGVGGRHVKGVVPGT